jgi:hypothetical protein
VLPPALKAKRAVINAYSNGNDCFKYAVLAALHAGEDDVSRHPLRRSTYQSWENDISFEDIPFPVGVRDLARVEAKNPGLAITAFQWADNKVQCLRTAALHLVEPWRPHRLILLLLIQSGIIHHWCAIKGVNRLMNRTGAHIFQWCDRCLGKFRSLTDEAHRQRCLERKDAVEEEMPKNKSLKFSDWLKTLSPSQVSSTLTLRLSPHRPWIRVLTAQLYQGCTPHTSSCRLSSCSTR